MSVRKQQSTYSNLQMIKEEVGPWKFQEYFMTWHMCEAGFCIWQEDPGAFCPVCACNWKQRSRGGDVEAL